MDSNRNIKYIGNCLDSINRGWVKIKVNNNNYYLSYGTKVKLIESSTSHELIEILEGNYRHKIAVLEYKLVNNGDKCSFLVGETFRLPSIKIIFKESYMQMNDTEYLTIFDKSKLKSGSYLVKFPIRTKKKLPLSYFDESKGGSRFCESWFPIMAEGELFAQRYIHFGSKSEGCITVVRNNRIHTWNDIYKVMINSRLDDHNIGTFLV